VVRTLNRSLKPTGCEETAASDPLAGGHAPCPAAASQEGVTGRRACLENSRTAYLPVAAEWPFGLSPYGGSGPGLERTSDDPGVPAAPLVPPYRWIAQGGAGGGEEIRQAKKAAGPDSGGGPDAGP
jgi:hypothetical protein